MHAHGVAGDGRETGDLAREWHLGVEAGELVASVAQLAPLVQVLEDRARLQVALVHALVVRSEVARHKEHRRGEAVLMPQLELDRERALVRHQPELAERHAVSPGLG